MCGEGMVGMVGGDGPGGTVTRVLATSPLPRRRGEEWADLCFTY